MVVPVRPVASLDRPSGSRIASSVRWARTTSTRSPDQAARDEQERPERVDVRPLRVVDDDGHRCLLLEFRKRLQYPRADADRLLHGQGAVASRPQPCGADPCDAHELVDDAVRDERLPLFARGAQHGQVGLVVQQAVQDRGLADPGWALEQDDPGPARADGRELAPQRGEFGPPPDEGPAPHGVVSHYSWRANRYTEPPRSSSRLTRKRMVSLLTP